MQTHSIKELRRLLLNESDFEKTKDYFFDWVSEHNSTAFGTTTKNKMLMTVLKSAISKVFKMDTIVFQNLLMHEVKGVHLIHGSANVEKITLAFFYFTDLDWGMMISFKLGSKEAGITRFRMIAFEKLDFNTDDQQN